MSSTWPLELEPGVRYDNTFLYAVADATRTPIPLAGFTAEFAIIVDGQVMVSADGNPGGATLTQEPGGATGWIDLSIRADVTARFLLPFGGGPDGRYYLQLVDNHDPTSVNRILHGPVTVKQEDS